MCDSPNVPASTRSLRRILTILACTIGPSLVSLIVLAPATALPALAAFFGSRPEDALFSQLVLTAPAITLIIAAPIAGMMGEKWGQKPILVAALCAFTLTGAAPLLTSDRTSFIFSRLILGGAGGAMLTASLALIGKLFDGHLREWVLGIATSLSAVIALTALAGGGMMVDHFGWQGPFYLYLLGLPAAALVLLIINDEAKSSVSVSVSVSVGRLGGWTPLFRLWPLHLIVLLFAAALFMPSIQGPFLLAKRNITSAAATGYILAAGAAISIVSAGLFGWIRKHLSIPTILTINAVCFACGMFLLGFCTGHGWMLLGCGLIGIGGGTTEPAAVSAMMSRLEPSLYGRASGVVISYIFMGQFLNPLLLSTIKTAYGIEAIFITMGLVSMWVALILLLTRRWLLQMM